eukprot:CAMPEP_0117743978 /NCGR_PEP_ID=MMETSP0947-20121206/6466_1 /TAXON_ID=44440 /ORGANISM="Chattonella subsalsa, Strain CCMP2191" /LENGTH=237 /DNA_ID=CAMNT_0005560801 /DNA_START=282 /DNA_END=995 /DNA_ORIENTATION=+
MDANVKGGLAELLKQEPFERPIERFGLDLLQKSLKLPKGPYAGGNRPPIEELYPPPTDAEDPSGSNAPAGGEGNSQQSKTGDGKAQAKQTTGTKQKGGKRAREKELPYAERVHRAIKGIVQQLWKHEVKGWGRGKRSPFAVVITQQNCSKLGVPNYFDFVEEPMNLTWIKEKSDKKKYSGIIDFIADCNLMFNNALKFNRKGEEVYTQAQLLKEKFDRWIESEPIISVIQEAKKQKT